MKINSLLVIDQTHPDNFPTSSHDQTLAGSVFTQTYTSDLLNFHNFDK